MQSMTEMCIADFQPMAKFRNSRDIDHNPAKPILPPPADGVGLVLRVLGAHSYLHIRGEY